MSLDRIVKINARLAAGGTVQRNFGRVLFLNIPGAPENTKEALRNARTGVYPTFAHLGEDWPVGEPRNAGSIFFQQIPYPQPFLVGAYNPAGALGYVFGGEPSTLDSIRGLSSYSGNPSGSAVLGGIIYFVDNEGEALFSIDKSNGAITRLAPIALHNASSLFTVDNRLYVINSQTNYLYEIVIGDNYRLEPLGAITGGPVNITGATSLTAGEVTTVYVIDGTQNKLYTLVVSTQVATEVGNAGLGNVADSPGALVTDETTLWCFDEGNHDLLSINTGTGAATKVADVTFNGADLTGIRAAFYDSALYAFSGETDSLYTVLAEESSGGASDEGEATLVNDLYRLRRLVLANQNSLFMNFSEVTTIESVAAVIQSAFSTVFAGGFTVSIDSGRLVLSNPSRELGKGFQNSEVSRTLGLFGPGVEAFNGSPAESIGESLDRILRENPDWYWLTLSEDIVDTDDVLEVQSWAAANERYLVLDSHQEAALDPDDVTSYLSRLSRIASQSYAGFFSRFQDYRAVSLAARFSSVNFSGNNTLITGKFRALPGCSPDDLTNSEIDALNQKRVNHYTTVGGVNIVQEGVAGSGWIDVKYWLDWFSSRIQTGLFDLLVSRERLPQTEVGATAISDILNAICEQGVRNGGIAPGQLTESLAGEIRNVTGNVDFTGYLSNGYLVYVSPLATQTQADREARRAPAVNVWVKGSGAVHFLEVSATFEQ